MWVTSIGFHLPCFSLSLANWESLQELAGVEDSESGELSPLFPLLGHFGLLQALHISLCFWTPVASSSPNIGYFESMGSSHFNKLGFLYYP